MAFIGNNLTLADLRRRVNRKINTDQVESDVDDWVNDVIQWITAEFPQATLLTSGDDTITGDGAKRMFDLESNFQHMMSVWHGTRTGYWVEGVSPQELIEDWEVFPVPSRDPIVYTIVGRDDNDANPSTFEPLRIRFDSIIPSGTVYKLQYYRLHKRLVSGTDVLYLPTEIQSLVVDGVILEASVFTDHDDYERHERKWMQKLRKAWTRRNRYPNRRYQMGSSSQLRRPARPVLPSNYPRF